MGFFSSFVIGLMGLVVAAPLGMQFFGVWQNPFPAAAQNVAQICQTGQKDKYGRCPFSGSSSFRSFSVVNVSGGTGSFGGSK